MQAIDDHGAGMDSGRSLHFGPEQERSQHQGLCRNQSKFLRDLISVMMLVVIKQNGIT